MSCNATTATWTIRLYIIGKVLKTAECIDHYLSIFFFPQAFLFQTGQATCCLELNTGSALLQPLCVVWENCTGISTSTNAVESWVWKHKARFCQSESNMKATKYLRPIFGCFLELVSIQYSCAFLSVRYLDVKQKNTTQLIFLHLIQFAESKIFYRFFAALEIHLFIPNWITNPERKWFSREWWQATKWLCSLLAATKKKNQTKNTTTKRKQSKVDVFLK